MLDDQNTIADTLAALKAACDAMPDSPGKRIVLKYYRAAEKAHIARDVPLTIIEIRAALAALGDVGGAGCRPTAPGRT